MDRGLDRGLHVPVPDHGEVGPVPSARTPAAGVPPIRTRERREPAPDTRSASDGGSPAEAQPAGLFQDIPGAIWAAFLAGWAGFFLLMWLFFAVNPGSKFAVVVAILFGLMAFGLPIVMAKQTSRPRRSLIEVVQTRTGPVSVRAAAVQIAMIPIAVCIGLLGFILFAK